MRDIRIMNMTQGQQIEYNEVMQRIGKLENRNLSALAKVALFDEGKALITNGFRVEPYSGMTVKVPTGTLVQREIDLSGNHGDIVGVCIQTEDQLIAMDAADGAPRTDIIEGQIISTVDRTDNARIGNVITGGGDTGSVVITNQTINRDIRYSLSIQKQKGTTTPTAATSASLTGTVAIAATIDLSEQYLLYMCDGEDSDWQEIDCRGAVPAATTRAEIISAINTAVGRTMAADGAGNTVELTGQGTGEISYFAFKPPITDSNADALEIIFGVSIGGLYKYEYEGTNSWIKLAEIDIGAADTEITAGMITDLDSKDSWTGGDDEILLKEPIMGDTLNVNTINEQTLNNGVYIEGVHLENSGIKVNWIRAAQVGSDLNIAGIDYPALAALNGTDVAFIDSTQEDLRCYRFDGTNWAQVGNDLNIAGIGLSALAVLNGTDVAFIDDVQEDLRCYRFDGTNWAQVGNDLNIAGIDYPALAALNGTDVAFIDSTQEDLRCYRFDGTNWAQVGNDLNIAGIGFSALAALNGTDVASIGGTQEDLRCYRFDGTNWAQVGNDLNIAGIDSPALAALNGTDVAFIDDIQEDLRCYRFDGTNWAQVGNDLNIAGSFPALAALNGTDVAFIDDVQEDLRCYRFSFSISGYPYNPTHPDWS